VALGLLLPWHALHDAHVLELTTQARNVSANGKHGTRERDALEELLDVLDKGLDEAATDIERGANE
jgi:hypothetical protein